MIRGELYRLDGEPPSQEHASFVIETGMILVGLRESIGDDRVADGGLRAIIMRGQRKMLNAADQAQSAAGLDISQQQAIADLAREDKEDGWMTRACLVAAALTHPEKYAESEHGSDEVRTNWGKTCFQLMADLWIPYAFTMKLFGWNLPERFFDEGVDVKP
jgi:hypothetical protein